MQEEDTKIGSSHLKVQSPREFVPLPFVAVALVYCAMLYVLSSISSFPVPSPFSFFDKIVHFFLFAGLSAVVTMGLYQARHQYSSKMLILIPVSFSFLYGLSDEIHQLAVPLREFSVGDLAADAVGAATAATALFLLHQRRKLKR